MSVRNVSGRTSRGLRTESARRPLYPTRPDPTRPFYTGETSHHVVTYVTRASAAGVVAGPVDEMMTGLSIIEGIDPDAEVPCGSIWCADDQFPAKYVIRLLKHGAHVASKGREGETRLICERCFKRIRELGIARCRCGEVVSANQIWRIVEVLR